MRKQLTPPAEECDPNAPWLPDWKPEPGETYSYGFYHYVKVEGTVYRVKSPDPRCPQCGSPLDDYPDYWFCDPYRSINPGCGYTAA